jgi:anti-sigma B factor antagonist
MQIDWKAVGEVEVICPCGRLDAYNSTEIENKLNSLIDSAKVKLVISFKELDYISSSGLRVLLATLKKVRKQQGDIRLACLKANVREVFELAGFTQLFTITENEETAVESFHNKKE